MSFLRKRLENYHIFLDVDFIVFCEGGQKTIGAEDAVRQSAQEAVDSIYWSKRITLKVAQGSSFCCRPLGGKSAVFDAFEKVRYQRTETLLFCVDSDHEQVLRRHENDSRILYTAGYSIENDIIDPDSISGLVQHVRPTTESQRASRVSGNIYQALCDQTSRLCRFIFSDVCSNLTDRKGLLNDGFSRFIKPCSRSKPPEVDYSLLRERALNENSNPRPKFRFTTPLQISPMSSLNGHALFDLFFSLFSWYFRQEFGHAPPGNKHQVFGWLCSCWVPRG